MNYNIGAFVKEKREHNALSNAGFDKVIDFSEKIDQKIDGKKREQTNEKNPEIFQKKISRKDFHINLCSCSFIVTAGCIAFIDLLKRIIRFKFYAVVATFGVRRRTGLREPGEKSSDARLAKP